MRNDNDHIILSRVCTIWRKMKLKVSLAGKSEDNLVVSVVVLFSVVGLFVRGKKLWNEDNFVAAERSFRQLLFLYETADHRPVQKACG